LTISSVGRASALLLCLAALRGAADSPAPATAPANAPAAAGDSPAGGMDPQSIAAFRCSQLNDPLACSAALSHKPEDPGLLVAEADALMSRGRPGEAIGVYRHAVRAGADRRSIASRLADAESLRRSLLRSCMSDSDAGAESDCEAAWLPGAPEEVQLFKRRGRLSRSAGRPAEALQAYVTAVRLAPGDHDAARAVIELTAGAGAAEAAQLLARGKAFIALGRPAEALAPLRQASGSATYHADAQRELKRAERLALFAASQQKADGATATSLTLARAGSLGVSPAREAPGAPGAPAADTPLARAVPHADTAPTRRAAPSNEAPPTRSN
jgi:tetratricopeptide (TPR) repeat protein